MIKKLAIFSIFIATMACDDKSVTGRHGNVRGNQPDRLVAPATNQQPSGSGRMIPGGSANLSQFFFTAYGANGQSLLYHTGKVRLNIRLTFSTLATSRISIQTGGNAYGGQCPAINREYQMTCHAEFANRSFKCSGPLQGGQYTIFGTLAPASAANYNYDVALVEIYGPCALNPSRIF